MAAKLLELNMDILGKLVESQEAPQNFVESVINDLPETQVGVVSNVEVAELNSVEIAKKAAQEFEHINGVVFKCVVDGKKAEVYLILEPVTYIKWWHDKSFFCDRFYRSHCHINDNVQRYVTFIITDSTVKANRFHNVSYFNKRDGSKDDSFQIHEIVAAKETGNEDSMLENWIRALVSKNTSAETENNVSDISEAKAYRVA